VLSGTSGINIRKEFAEGEEAWTDMLLQFDDLFFVHEKRRRCGTEHGHTVVQRSGSDTPKCNMWMDMALAREGQAKCTIVETEVGPVDDAADDFCWPYAECLAEARVGEEVPCPPEAAAGAEPVVRLYLQALHQPKLFDVEFVGRLIEDHHKLSSARKERHSKDYTARYLRRVSRRYLEYLEWHHQQLVASAETSGVKG